MSKVRRQFILGNTLCILRGIKGIKDQGFKLQVLREVEAGKAVAQVAREYQLHPSLIDKWQRR